MENNRLTAGPVNPSELQNTAASLFPKSSSQTVPQTPRYFTSTRPSKSVPSIKRYSIVALQCIGLSSVSSSQSTNYFSQFISHFIPRFIFLQMLNEFKIQKMLYFSKRLPLTPSHMYSIGMHCSDSWQSQ